MLVVCLNGSKPFKRDWMACRSAYKSNNEAMRKRSGKVKLFGGTLPNICKNDNENRLTEARKGA